MWFIGVKVEQETSAPAPKKNPGSAPVAASSGLQPASPLVEETRPRTSRSSEETALLKRG